MKNTKQKSKMKVWVATCGARTLKLESPSPYGAIKTAAKVFGVKLNKVAVRQV